MQNKNTTIWELFQDQIEKPQKEGKIDNTNTQIHDCSLRYYE